MIPSRSPRVQPEGLAKRASLRTIGDWIVLEDALGEASLTSLRWGIMVQTTPRYGSNKVHTPDWKNTSCTAWKDEKRSPRIHLEGLESLAQRASLRTIEDWIVLEYVLGEASLTSLRWGQMVQTTPRYGSVKVPEGTTWGPCQKS